MTEFEWLKDSLDRIEDGQKEGFALMNGRMKKVETSVAVHEDQINGKDGIHDDVSDIKKIQTKLDKRMLIFGMAILGGTGVTSNLGPIGDVIKGLIGL